MEVVGINIEDSEIHGTKRSLRDGEKSEIKKSKAINNTPER
jgi:hypothetical protein